MWRYLKKNKIKSIVSAVVLLIILYYSSGYFFIYNNDAYINANLISVASSVSGRVADISVKDNQLVKKGEALLVITKKPFLLALNQANIQLKQATLSRQKGDLQVTVARNVAESKLEQTKLLKANFSRISLLHQQNAVSTQRYQQAETAYLEAQDLSKAANNNLQIAVQQTHLADIKVKQMMSKLAMAKYQLSLTTIHAPFDGFINNLQIHSGDYAIQGQTLFGLIKDSSQYITANIKSSNLPLLKNGISVWVYVSIYPWHLYHGVIESIGYGVAREASISNSALPYVKPVTSWIRYDYRVPVHIKLTNFPKNKTLRVGTGAKVFIFP